jgi:hypothetical protein
MEWHKNEKISNYYVAEVGLFTAVVYTTGRRHPEAWGCEVAIDGEVMFSPKAQATLALAKQAVQEGLRKRLTEALEVLDS